MVVKVKTLKGLRFSTQKAAEKAAFRKNVGISPAYKGKMRYFTRREGRYWVIESERL